MPVYSGRKKLLAALISVNAVSGFTLVWPVAAAADAAAAAAAKPEDKWSAESKWKDLSAETEFHTHSDIFPCGHFFVRRRAARARAAARAARPPRSPPLRCAPHRTAPP